MALTKVTSGLISADASSVDLNIDAGTLYIDSTNNRVIVNTANPAAGSAFDAPFQINGATVGSTAGNTGKIANLGFNSTTTNHVGLGVTAYRASAGSDWTTTGIKFTYDIDNSTAVYDNMLCFQGGNVGIGNSSPSTFNVVPADDLVIGDGTGSRGITIYGSTTSTGMLVFADGTATGDQYKGLIQYYHAEDRMTFHTNNLERMRIDSSGNLMVGTTSAVTGNSLATVSTGITASSSTSPALQLYCSGAGSNEKYWRWTSKTTGEIRLEQVNDAYSSPTERMRITSTGQFLMPGVYNDTTADATNVNVRSDGLQRRSTSSMRYKNSITDATHGLAEVMQLRSVTYKGNNDGDTIFGGLIAEEVDEVGLTEFVEYDNEGRPDALRYQHMVSLLTKAIQEQQTIIEDLKARITALEGN